MFLISNNCIAAYIYQFNAVEFNHPFMWSVINLPDMINLINFFNEINFNNISIDFYKSTNKVWNNTPIVNIDNMINVHYIHTKIGSGQTIRKNGDLYIDNPLIGVHQAYLRRIKRMYTQKVMPEFVINQSNCEEYTADGIKRLFDLIKRNDANIHIVCDQSTLMAGQYNNIHVYNDVHCCTGGINKRALAHNIMTNCHFNLT